MTLIGHNIARTKLTNKRTVLQCLLRYGSISRQQIAVITDLTPATISNLTSELIEEGLVMEMGILLPAKRRVGRKSIALALNPNACCTLGVHMSANEVQIGQVNLYGIARTIRRNELPLQLEQGQFIDRLLADIDACVTEASDKVVTAIGIGLVGLVDFDKGVYLSREHLGWKDVPLESLLRERHRIPVYVDNNVRTMALAEKMFGAGRKLTDFLFIYIGQGIGSGLVIGDRLYRGGQSGAGEFGHMTYMPDGPECWCGNWGCLEKYASHAAIIKELGANGTADLLLRLDQGDRLAEEAVSNAGRKIGTVLASYINMFYVPNIVVGGVLSKETYPLLGEIRRELMNRSYLAKREHVQITASELGDGIGLAGAAALAQWNEIFEIRRQ
jgi:N-acetylglucosamine repressor